MEKGIVRRNDDSNEIYDLFNGEASDLWDKQMKYDHEEMKRTNDIRQVWLSCGMPDRFVHVFNDLKAGAMAIKSLQQNEAPSISEVKKIRAKLEDARSLASRTLATLSAKRSMYEEQAAREEDEEKWNELMDSWEILGPEAGCYYIEVELAKILLDDLDEILEWLAPGR